MGSQRVSGWSAQASRYSRCVCWFVVVYNEGLVLSSLLVTLFLLVVPRASFDFVCALPLLAVGGVRGFVSFRASNDIGDVRRRLCLCFVLAFFLGACCIWFPLRLSYLPIVLILSSSWL